MSEPEQDESAARLDEALAANQRQERSEVNDDIVRQRRADEALIDALSRYTLDAEKGGRPAP